MLKRTSSQEDSMHDESRLFAIGELARQTGLATSALRYYERFGLLRPAVRREDDDITGVECRARSVDPTLPGRRVHTS